MTGTVAATAATKRPTARRGRPSRVQEREITDTIVQTALRLFLADGYGATSMKRIGEEAGVAPNTLYARFPDKAALFRALIEWKTATWKVTNPQRRIRTGAGLIETIETVFIGMLEAAQREDVNALGKLLAMEAERFPELARIYRENAMEAGRDEVLERLLTAPDADLRQEDAIDLVTTIFELVVGHSGSRIFQDHTGGAPTVRQAARRMARIVGAGFVQPSASSTTAASRPGPKASLPARSTLT